VPELQIVPVAQLTRPHDIFRCIPYSCAMMARRCVERQATADSDFPPAALLQCKGCSLGAQVKERVGSQVVIDPHAAARASRKRVPGTPPRKSAPRAPSPEFAPKPTHAERRSELALQQALGQHIVKRPAPAVVHAPPEPPLEHDAKLRAAFKEPARKGPPRVDMVGRALAGVRVLREGDKTHAGVCWVVEHIACGHTEQVPGQTLRTSEKAGSKRRCQECRDVAADAERELLERPAPASEPPPPAHVDEDQPTEGDTMAAKKKKGGRQAADMTGEKLAGVKVIERGKQQPSGPAWVVEHPKCGHIEEVLGAVLRQTHKNGGKRACRECREAGNAPAKTRAPKPARAPKAERATTSAPPQRRRVAVPSSGERQPYAFPLRPDFMLSVELPSDFNASDQKRAARWLETLVFEDA
jgi:hypothetical protein